MSTDTQVIEAIGENLVINQFLREGYEVARPIRDNGVDLVVYRFREGEDIEALPVQVKVSTKSAFGIDRKYERYPGLMFVLVWDIESRPSFYRFTYEQALEIASEKGWLETDSWKSKGAYVNNKPGAEIRRLLARYEWPVVREAEEMPTH